MSLSLSDFDALFWRSFFYPPERLQTITVVTMAENSLRFPTPLRRKKKKKNLSIDNIVHEK
jgi:hypothetical protein